MGIFTSIINLFKWIINAILTIIKNIFNGFKESIYGIQIQKKQTKRFDVDVYVIDKNSNLEVLKGKITPDREILYIPSIQKFIYKPDILHKYGQSCVIISLNQHDSIGFRKEKQLKEIVKGELTIKTKTHPYKAKKIILKHSEITDILNDWRYDDILTTVNVKFKGGSLDLTNFDSKYSIPFGSQANLIVKADLFSFIKKSTDMGIITSVIIGTLLGMVIHSIWF